MAKTMDAARPSKLCMTTICVVAFSILDLAIASTGSIYKVTNATSKELPYNDETVLKCEMNVPPDLYKWRFYPLAQENANKPETALDLSSADYVDLSPHMYKNEKKRSTLTIKMTSWNVAGDYQCLAHYGALVIASIPDRITLATMDTFAPQNDSYITVAKGNTILWKCKAPVSNPPAYIDYSQNGSYVPMQRAEPKQTSLIIANVDVSDSGTYKCKATNAYLDKDGKIESNFSLYLKVTDHHGREEMPRFWPVPSSYYIVKRGESVFLECNAVGFPVPNVTWTKPGHNLPPDRAKMLPAGLQIVNATAEDAGVYKCEVSNRLGRTQASITLIYTEPPTVTQGPSSKTVKEGDNVELSCNVRGLPPPRITWLLNGQTVLHDSQIEVGGKNGNQINFKSFEKRHGGRLQCFVTNSVGTTYSGCELKVFPKQVSSSESPAHTQHHAGNGNANNGNKKQRKHNNNRKKLLPGSSEMIPPAKPTVSRSNDESVVVRWTVPNNNGLHITFFKVQYRELGPASSNETKGRASRWKTNNSDIAPNIRSFEVTGLKSDYWYKFRIAAVYSNNDNKLSPKSDRFHLKREGFYAKHPLPVPAIIHKNPINTTSIKIFWTYTPNSNVSVDGFLISYMSASSAADYMKATADGENTTSYIITHLSPDTVYDVKMQSYNTKSASDFSSIVKCKTQKLPTEAPPTITIREKEKETAENDSSLYIFIGLGVGTLTLLLSAIVCFITCKWKQNKADKTRGDRDKPAVEANHHIQAEVNDFDYMNPKSPRSNGCALPGNRITITANPLADADNKGVRKLPKFGNLRSPEISSSDFFQSQNMIEMSCLSNNNCPTAPSASNDDDDGQQADTQAPDESRGHHPLANNKVKHKKAREHHRRRKHHLELERPPPIENYV